MMPLEVLSQAGFVFVRLAAGFAIMFGFEVSNVSVPRHLSLAATSLPTQVTGVLELFDVLAVHVVLKLCLLVKPS